jgi:putative transposase
MQQRSEPYTLALSRRSARGDESVRRGIPAQCPGRGRLAAVRHRTIRSKGCLSNKTALAMVFKLVEGAQKSWRRLDGHNQLPKLALGVTFNDGIEVIAKTTDRQPTTAAA